MVVAASPDTYMHVIEYGLKKTKLRVDRLLMQAFMAGVYVGMAAHCCTTLAGGYSTDASDPLGVSKSTQKFLYASIFPVAFVSIILTGAELFTGNTMTMLICVLERKIRVIDLIINWTCSLIGNWGGALFSAFFLSYLTGAVSGDSVKHFLDITAVAKTNYSFGECFLRGVGCNTYVCLAVWFVIACDDAAGKILALWFPIVAFCVGGYEHIIANFYTLQVALMVGAPVSVADVILKNFIPTLLGNIVGGCGLVGAVYWFNFYPTTCMREGIELSQGPQTIPMTIPVMRAAEAPAGPNEIDDASPSAPTDAKICVKSRALSLTQRRQKSKRFSVAANENVYMLPKETFGGEYRPPTTPQHLQPSNKNAQLLRPFVSSSRQNSFNPVVCTSRINSQQHSQINIKMSGDSTGLSEGFGLGESAAAKAEDSSRDSKI